ncbi:tRNA-uridine aminocarboxypropyltransferase [Pseudomonas sp. 10B1]|uniref:tRNA-uridine aminocarboxypropyltransferase n=1 Tax=unclassified Pseudomonas TaxID=196821 RepID=UPI002AB47FF3|nr:MULTISPECIES: tRNA-uridine aminocarboxypropyltransferase [unclassified Pseudomonas]MDY7559382.1 tRNA-uridine aminocarboxypropyltransferase [Pseudomonas sp. AB6]MEA9978815.1 tRNA-uridine aminocarboxypropyltransferase [Pseudomonas sp. RTS4]MEA9996602.1 tRNA-uridine aminocarboxypropyltransferase [Pseudomonas sp. AA4]MEB0087901.1 tRNA-uridine aminocarboxypropyltransferase [Pseudomonas sp. RTI1]MEB0128156.1 tRNA-uridine aminocarboxypropyltransferase [Pseudomonas sp. CCC1.2]
MSHAVSRLRAQRLARAVKPFVARGSRAPRCPGCRVIPSYCLCAWRPTAAAKSAMCLLMYDVEPLKPTNTGWLIADVIEETHAFGWSRTEVDAELPALLSDPQWQPYIVFPGEFVAPERVVTQVKLEKGKRPLFILLDATWSEARKMFRKSPYLDHLPVLSLEPEQISRYRLRRSRRDDHFCTAEVAALCLELAGDQAAGGVLDAYLDVFSAHYMGAKHLLPVDLEDGPHTYLKAFL